MLKAALWYLEQMNFSIIPIKKNKRPFIKWTEYQTTKPTVKQVRQWWEKWPHANIGIVTGAVSGINVVDCDSETGKEAINEFLPDTLLTPISKTPKGWHYYFKYQPGLSNGVRIITDCDLRTDGGYVIAPPSKNGNGKGYDWDLKIKKNPLEVMPEMLYDILGQGGLTSELSSEHIKKDVSSSDIYVGSEGERRNNLQQKVTNRNISFSEPGRDDTLFHLANHLVKSGMPQTTIEKYLTFFGQNCNPPFPKKDLEIKIQSAFQRLKKRNFGLMDEIRKLISVTSGNISVTYAYQAVTSVTKNEKAAVRMAFKRLTDEGLLEKTGRKAGEYRIIDGECEPENWQDAKVSNVKVWLPFELDTMLDIPAGSVILFAGSQDAGKSAIMMNIAKENRHEWNAHYFSSELHSASFKNRMSKFEDVTVDMLSDIKFYPRGHGFQDVIKTGEKDLNIIDYLEVHDQFYKVAEYLDQIYRKLNGKGLAIVAIQKDPHKEYGRGGSFVEEKPVLSIALDRGGIATINKFKGEWYGSNPRGKQYNYKIVNGSKLKPARVGEHWHTPINIK